MSRNRKFISLTDRVNRIVARQRSDPNNELQSMIHPEIHFRRCSVNLLIGKRGSGKTFNVFRELTKLALVDNDRYTQLLYVTDKKETEPTVKRFEEDVTLPRKTVTYADIDTVLKDTVDAIAAYDCVVENDCADKLDSSSFKEITEAVGVDDFSVEKPHTIVLYDDAMNVFKKIDSYCYKALFQNRQPRITYFLCIQDPKGVDTSIKNNLDSMWVFGGMTRQKINNITYQSSLSVSSKELWSRYSQLSLQQFMIIDNLSDGTDVKFVLD